MVSRGGKVRMEGWAGHRPGEAAHAGVESDFKTLSWSQRASPASGVKSGLSGRVTPGA